MNRVASPAYVAARNVLAGELRREMNKQMNQEEGSSTERPKANCDFVQIQQHEASKPKEIGGPKGLEPTRYGDWERKGRCIDF